ncbi:MAG: hypothetical protein K6F15_05275 [Treponema sp.]|nr:hypothetical protein [Treponema sp.]
MYSLPITPFLPKISESLKNSESHFLVLTAETAAGKSTGLPPFLLNEFPGKILMLEPRRLAVLSIASRIAETLGQEVGKTVGYRMHLEKKLSAETRLEIITEAILTKKLQEDPSLEGTSLVIIDEFHERSIHADLALAFLKEAMTLRDDLFVIVMSATIETDKLTQYLSSDGRNTPFLQIPGRQFPVEIEYAGKKEMSLSIKEALPQLDKGSALLAFLPGISQIRKTQAELLQLGYPDESTDVMLLHSSINFSEQKKVLQPIQADKKRIILSSAIAETSLTVPGVKIVIDSGLCRVNKMNVALGMEGLVTENESLFSAEQRAGRAGRLGPGKCIRLWSKHDVRLINSPAEILRSDITPLVLECVAWGAGQPGKIDWLEAPSLASWNEALKLLQELACVKDSSVTALGKACLKLPLHPRLACLALSGFERYVVDFTNYAKASSDIQKKFVKDLEERVAQITKEAKKPLLQPAKNLALALLSGFPDRLAMQVSEDLYQFPNGRMARIKKDMQKKALLPKWIVAAEVDAGFSQGLIYKYCEVNDSDAEEWLKGRTECKEEISFEGEKIKKTQDICYGKLVLSSKRLASSPEDYAKAICNKIKEKGMDFLPLSDETKMLIIRQKFYAQQKGIEAKALEVNLCQNVEDWLLPFVAGKTKIDSKSLYDALYWYLDGSSLDKEVPLLITLPNGKKRKIIYELQSDPQNRTKLVIRPVLEVIIQQIFACFSTPEIMGMPLLFKLLSPARRPLQITDNLEEFWTNSWIEICKEMKGRYPKHNWDYRIAEKD